MYRTPDFEIDLNEPDSYGDIRDEIDDSIYSDDEDEELCGPECENCGCEITDSTIGGYIQGRPYCVECYSGDFGESKKIKSPRMRESMIAGPCGVSYSYDHRTAAKDAVVDQFLASLKAKH